MKKAILILCLCFSACKTHKQIEKSEVKTDSTAVIHTASEVNQMNYDSLISIINGKGVNISYEKTTETETPNFDYLTKKSEFKKHSFKGKWKIISDSLQDGKLTRIDSSDTSRRVTTNLLTNQTTYYHKGGKRHLSGRTIEDVSIPTTKTKTTEKWTFSLIDTTKHIAHLKFDSSFVKKSVQDSTAQKSVNNQVKEDKKSTPSLGFNISLIVGLCAVVFAILFAIKKLKK